MANKIIEINGKQHNMRIRARDVAQVSKMLDGKSYTDAIFDSLEHPVENVVPFLWGSCQKPDTEKPFTEEDAFGLFDGLVDKGYAGSDWPKLITEICTVSGFFNPAVADNLIGMMTAMTDKMANPEIMKKISDPKQKS